MTTYSRELKGNRIFQSMSRKGNCYDNSVMENFFGLLKQEIYYGNTYYSFDELKEAIDKSMPYIITGDFNTCDFTEFDLFVKEARITLSVNALILHLNRIVYEQLNPHTEREQLSLYQNLIYYIDRSGKSQKDLAEMVGVAPSTFNDWVKAKKYPRIDKIEILANYFGIQKSDLIEEKMTEEKEKDNDILADIIVRMRMDEDFFSVVESLYNLDSAKINGVQEMLKAFTK